LSFVMEHLSGNHVAHLRAYFSRTARRLACLLTVICGIAANAQGLDSLSLSSYKLELYAGAKYVGSATGFVVKHEGSLYLITNWHVVTGRDRWTDSLISITKADTIAVWFQAKTKDTIALTWVRERMPLYGSDSLPLWHEHPSGRRVDVVALEIEPDSTKIVRAIDLRSADADVWVRVAMNVSVIGFPRGLEGGGKLPIWKSGQLASEPEVDFRNDPTMLIDVRTIEGMSGSPAFLRIYGGYWNMHAGFDVGKTGTRFLGVYSGRVPVELADKATRSDLGIIWKPIVIEEILDGLGKK